MDTFLDVLDFIAYWGGLLFGLLFLFFFVGIVFVLLLHKRVEAMGAKLKLAIAEDEDRKLKEEMERMTNES